MSAETNDKKNTNLSPLTDKNEAEQNNNNYRQELQQITVVFNRLQSETCHLDPKDHRL